MVKSVETGAKAVQRSSKSGDGKYDGRSISVLKGLEPVRRRPAMYIGGVDLRGLHHLIWEVLDNSIDEAINGHASTIEVELDKDAQGILIVDNGRGIPVDKHPETKRPTLETILTTLHAGGKFDGNNYRHSGGLHGVGSSVVNALSKKLIARVRRDGFEYMQEFRRGKPVADMKKVGPAKGSGTSIYFKPDDEIFAKIVFDPKRIVETLEARAYLHRGLRIVWRDRATDTSATFKFDEGIVAYLDKLTRDRGVRKTADFVFYHQVEADPCMEVALHWTDDTNEHVKSYVNGVLTPSGGTHEQGLKAGVVRALRNFIDTHELAPRGITLSAEDLREGLGAVLSVYLAEPQFQGQTKDRLNNPEVTPLVTQVVGNALEQYFNQNGTNARAIVARGVLAARAREASRAAVATVKRKTAVSHRLNLPGKLADCESTRPDESEIFIVEGDSAGGSAKQARDRRYQAILPLRGKVLNIEQASLAKVLANKELADIVSALGCGMAKSFDISKLRYHKVVILTDADSDGHHIMTLLLTFFYRHMPELIGAGHIYLGMPPLFRIDHRGETHWAWSEGERAQLVASLPGKVSENSTTRFKGLGEMTPDQLKVTAMSPRTRALQRVHIVDALETDKVVNELMGKDSSARYRFVMERAAEADDLDV